MYEKRQKGIAQQEETQARANQEKINLMVSQEKIYANSYTNSLLLLPYSDRMEQNSLEAGYDPQDLVNFESFSSAGRGRCLSLMVSLPHSHNFSGRYHQGSRVEASKSRRTAGTSHLYDMLGKN